MQIAAIADDFTGATDLASMLARGGLRTELVLGRPEQDLAPIAVDALVIALKSRTAPVAEAVADSLASWQWAAAGGARRCYVKYCSTFDSTPEGNIGPVAEALMDALGASQTVYTPAFPENGRSIYMGKLFVGDRLLSETGMRTHPLTPMTESDLCRVLAPQLSAGAQAGLVRWPIVRQGPAAVAAALEALASDGVGHVVVDALDQGDLDALAEVVRDWPLVTAGSGLALSLGRLLAGADPAPARLPEIGGPTVLLSGSCSDATNAQVARWLADGGSTIRIDPMALATGDADYAAPMADAVARGPALLTATAGAEAVKAVQATLGTDRAATLIETALARVASHLLDQGVRRFIVAGGETSGAVASALGVRQMAVGPSIAPGVPWCVGRARDGAPVALALKSGNFGRETFFADALEIAP